MGLYHLFASSLETQKKCIMINIFALYIMEMLPCFNKWPSLTIFADLESKIEKNFWVIKTMQIADFYKEHILWKKGFVLPRKATSQKAFQGLLNYWNNESGFVPHDLYHILANVLARNYSSYESKFKCWQGNWGRATVIANKWIAFYIIFS